MIKVTDIAFGRLEAPDLDIMEEFLLDFGMVRADRTKTKLFMRGTDSEHHLHVTELGGTKFIGLAFHAKSEEDLEILSKAEGASAVEEIDEPGGGKRVRMTDPNGLQVEAIWGMEQLDPLPVRDITYNNGKAQDNRKVLQRIKMEPSHVKRSAHCVFRSTDLNATNAWYNKHLGLAKTDDIYVEEKDNLLATFNHIDAGDEFVDHHVLLAVQSDSHAFNHLSFEVADFDDVQVGHEFLTKTGKYRHAWGVGRHVLGSQIFDYWRDPWGRIHEHWTDSDRVNMDHKPSLHSTDEGLVNQWGPDFPADSFLDDPENHAVQPIPA